MVSLANPIDRLDWALFSVVMLFHHWFPLLEKNENRAFILPHNIPTVFIIFAGQGGQPTPSPWGRGDHPWSTLSTVLHLGQRLCKLLLFFF